MLDEVFENRIITDLSKISDSNSRKRQHFNLHKNFNEKCQVLINFLKYDTYIRPHNHSDSMKSEYIFCLMGEVGIAAFNQNGDILEKHILKPLSGNALKASEAFCIKFTPKTYHTVLCLSDEAVILEVKEGPFDNTKAKKFAKWSFSDDNAKSKLFLQNLKQKIIKS